MHVISRDTMATTELNQVTLKTQEISIGFIAKSVGNYCVQMICNQDPSSQVHKWKTVPRKLLGIRQMHRLKTIKIMKNQRRRVIVCHR